MTTKHWLEWATWAFRGNVQQVVGVPTPIGIKIAFEKGQEALVLGAHLYTGTVGAVRLIELIHLDVDTTRMMQLMGDSLDTNQKIIGPAIKSHNAATDTPNTVGVPYMPCLISGEDYLQVQGTSLANTEYVYCLLRLRLSCPPRPTLTAIGAGITVTEGMNKFI